jgi:hypothetical protein
MNDMFPLLWAVVLGYPTLQAWALWQCRGAWRRAAMVVLATAGIAYLWCVWVLFVSPFFRPSPGNLQGLFEIMTIAIGGPAVLVVLIVIVVGGRMSQARRLEPPSQK